MANLTEYIGGDRIEKMIAYRLGTPRGSILGSDFGDNAPDYLHSPLQPGMADDYLSLFIEDVPALQSLKSRGQVAIYAYESGLEQARIILNVASLSVEIPASIGNY